MRVPARRPLAAEETVLLPPAVTLPANHAMLARLQALDAMSKPGVAS